MKTTIKYGDSENEKIEFNTKNVSIIGGNGSGKSSLMRKIKKQNPTFTIISAHKNLVIRQGQFRNQDDVWLSQHKSNYTSHIYGGVDVPPDNNSMQDDFNQIIEIIFRDYSSETIEAFNAGKKVEDTDRKLDKIFIVWNSIFTDKRLL